MLGFSITYTTQTRRIREHEVTANNTEEARDKIVEELGINFDQIIDIRVSNNNKEA